MEKEDKGGTTGKGREREERKVEKKDGGGIKRRGGLGKEKKEPWKRRTK